MALLAMAVVAGCREPGLRNGRGPFEAAPGDVDFGAVALGREREVEVSLTNRGRVPYNVQEVRANVPGVSVDFEPLRLHAGQTSSLKLRFRPKVEGAVVGQLTIFTDEHPDPYGVNVGGRGVNAVAALDSAALDFGRVELETKKVLTLTVRNPADVETAVRFTLGGEVAHYSSPEAGRDLLLQPGEAREIPFEFNPTFLGPLAAQATFTLCEACAPSVVTLNGEGFIDKLEVDPSRIDFGRVSLGTTATEQVFVRNLGTEVIPFRGAEIVDAPEGLFSVTWPSGDLPVGGQLILTVSFMPKTPGVVPPGAKLQLNLAAKNVGSGTVKVPITGEGGLFCVAILPPALDFGTVPEGATATRRVDLMNRCAYDVTLLEAAIPENGDGSFALAQPSSATVLPAKTITSVRVTFTPRRALSSTAGAMTLVIQEKSATTTEQVELKGASKLFGPCSWQLLPPLLDYGALPVGTETTLGVALKNVGTDECFVGGMQLVAGSDPQFKAEPVDSSVIKPGETAVLRVSFRPSAVGTFSAQMEGWISDPVHGHPTAVLNGRGVEGCFSLQPATVDYGPIGLACGPRTRTVTASNACAVPVNITRVQLDAPATQELTLSGKPSVPRVLAPGQTTTFEVTYTPTNDGLDAAALRVTADGKRYTAGFHGEGQSQPTVSDLFLQDAQTKVDVLFVIDNSGSMTEEQLSLGVNFNAFLSAAQLQYVDYHIGVTTTGIDPSPAGWSVCPGGVGGGEAGRLFPVVGGGPRIITPTTPNAATVFANNVNVGWCHWNEQGLEAAYRALSAPLVNGADDLRTIQTNDGNAGFLRPEAKLALVFVTDEEDFSLGEVSFYERFFHSVKNDDPTLLSISAIVGPADLTTCPTAASTGSRYIALANATGGAIESICSTDWSKGLANISRTTFGPKRAFPLSGVPRDASQVSVTVNGAPATGWTYDPQRNTVLFGERQAPRAGSVVEIKYPLGC